MSLRRVGGLVALAVVLTAAAGAPLLAPHDPHEQYAHFPAAPPMRPHLVDEQGVWHAPFFYPIRLSDRLAGTYEENRSRLIPMLSGFRSNAAGAARDPIFLLGTDALGRDLLSRLLLGARASLGIACAAGAGALVIGILIGLVAGYAGGVIDAVTMRVAESLLVLPALYVVLALRAALPLVLEPAQVFVGVAGVLAFVGWPSVARGVRAVVAVECSREYVEAARACGAATGRVLLRHVLPAAGPFIATQAALLLPGFAIAEATLSFAGFGFAEPTPSWGTMLQEAANLRAITDRPWLLAPAAALALVSWALHAVAERGQPRLSPWSASHRGRAGLGEGWAR